MANGDNKNNGNPKVDYFSLYAHGLSTEQILDGAKQRGLSVDDITLNDYNTVYNQYAVGDNPQIDPTKLQEIYNRSVDSYDRFKQGVFNDFVANPYQYASSGFGTLSGNIDRTAVGPMIPYGYDEDGRMTATPEEVAAARGYRINRNGEKESFDGGDFWKAAYNITNFLSLGSLAAGDYVGRKFDKMIGLDEYSIEDPNKYTTIVVPDERGIPYMKEVLTSSPEAKRERIMSAVGPTPISDNWMTAVNKSVYNALIPGMQSMTGSAMEITDNLWDLAFNDENKEGWLEKQGVYLQNIAGGYMGKESERAKQGTFNNWESALYNVSGVAAQQILQFGMGSLIRGGVAKLGETLSSNILKDLGTRGSINLHTTSAIFGMMAMDSYNQFAKENKIDPLDIAWQAPLVGMAEYLTEVVIGPGVIAKGTDLVFYKSQIKNAINEYATKTQKELGVDALNDLTKEQKQGFIKGLVNKIGQIYKTPRSKWQAVLSSSIEESLEEVVAQPMQNTVEYLNDWRALAVNPAAKAGDGMFQDIENYGEYKSFFNKEFLDRLPQGMGEAAVLGFFGGLMGSASVLRGKYQQKTLQDIVADGEAD